MRCYCKLYLYLFIVKQVLVYNKGTIFSEVEESRVTEHLALLDNNVNFQFNNFPDFPKTQ